MSSVRWLAAIAGAAMLGALAFYGLPWLDLTVTRWFYDPERGFWLADAGPVRAVYHGVRYLTFALALALLGLLLWSCLSSHPRARPSRKPLAFLVAVLVLGPWLITHHVFKDQWGRPRPEAIAEFGGSGHYVRPGVLSDQCETNCSFPSGHAAAAFYLIALAWVFPQRRRAWMLIGILAGSLAGLARIVQGGHFVSDILFSFVVIFATATALATAMRLGR